MLLFGHKLIKSEQFYHIGSLEHIPHTPPSSTLYLHFSQENLEIITYLQNNAISFALYTATLQEVIFAHNLGASYIVVPKELAKTAQDVAQNYLFDAKILVLCSDDAQIEEFALLGVDGVIFGEAIIKVS